MDDLFDRNSILLTDRVALVTGAAVGIGAATARLFARCGATLSLCDRDAEGLAATAAAAEAAGATVHTGVLDVRDSAAVDTYVAGAVEQLGKIDVLVNNAGGTFVSPFLDVSAKGEASLIAENFTQVTHFIRTVVPHMPDGGSIINLTSVEAHQAGPGFAVYAAMKTAVSSLSKSLALELGGRRIRVNNIASDAQPSEGEKEARAAMLASEPEFMPAYTPPVGFFGTPEDSAAAALYLASDLSRLVTGSTIHVDGGTWAAGGWQRQ
ncbi:MAG: SDR family oxidoreductase [Acidimicrobiales bacterium]|jgi:NAD(P)-dependent dehydrogenase (short-subunit alcohol dehydrogenase family)|nr:SDR family oxidoreductase [Acidimicrobiales bacterium]